MSDIKSSTMDGNVFICPCCDDILTIGCEASEIPSHFTMDCDSCDSLLMAEDGVVYPFHEKMHESDKRWPADGAGTGSIGC
jgi:hypothetical protein